MKESLTRKERVRKRSDFKNAFNGGNSVNCTGSRLVFVTNNLNMNRFAVTFVRNYGNAVQRNRSRRVLKEIYRLNKHKIKNGFDFVVVLYSGTYTYIEHENQFYYLMKKSGLLL